MLPLVLVEYVWNGGQLRDVLSPLPVWSLHFVLYGSRSEGASLDTVRPRPSQLILCVYACVWVVDHRCTCQ